MFDFIASTCFRLSTNQNSKIVIFFPWSHYHTSIRLNFQWIQNFIRTWNLWTSPITFLILIDNGKVITILHWILKLGWNLIESRHVSKLSRSINPEQIVTISNWRGEHKQIYLVLYSIALRAVSLSFLGSYNFWVPHCQYSILGNTGPTFVK